MTLPDLANAMPHFPPRRAVASDADRVRDAVEKHYDAIWCFVRRLGVRDSEVEDAAQKVFMVFANRVREVASSSERSFLFASAMRVASDVRRKAARSREVLVDNHVAHDAVDPAPSLDERIDARRRRRWLDDVLDTLSDEHRAVLVLVDIEEQTMAEAGDVLGIPQGTVASRLRRARELFEEAADSLRVKLEKENV